MNQQTAALILALLPVAERLIFEVGGKLIEISTADLKSPEDAIKALDAARKEGFPELKFFNPN